MKTRMPIKERKREAIRLEKITDRMRGLGRLDQEGMRFEDIFGLNEAQRRDLLGVAGKEAFL